MKTIETKIDFSAHYQIDGWRGIAFYLRGYATKNEPVISYGLDENGDEIEIETGECDEVEDREHVIAVMVGDDRKHVVAIEDIHVIPEISFCRDCGQIGCHCNNYE